jgi:SPP1 gp7 family putative phage head morphogenesis protein
VKITPYDPIVSRVVAGVLSVSDSLRGQLLESLAGSADLGQWFASIVPVVFAHEPLFEEAARLGQIAGWLKGAAPVARKLPEPEGGELPSRPATLRPAAERPPELLGVPISGGLPPYGPRPPLAPAGAAGDEPKPVVRLPIIETAAQTLAEKGVITPAEFKSLDANAQRRAFTVARVQSLETLQRLRDGIAEQVAKGGTLDDFKKAAAKALEDGPALSERHIETVIRTNVASAYGEGQRAVLDHRLVADAFPYVKWSARHDSRVRKDHLAMEKSGIDGTAVYRADDPLIRACWPPAGYNCRCHLIPLSIADAAKLGVREAQEWLASGVPPSVVAWVKSVPIKLPDGWVPGGVAV